jgi:predicted lipase
LNATCRLGPIISNEDPVQFVIALQHSKQRVIVAFRGTNSAEQLLKIITQSWSHRINGTQFHPVSVLYYFHKKYEQLHPLVQQRVMDQLKQHPGYTVVLTGHSLGGALATLAAYYLYEPLHAYNNTVASLITFGSPRVGNWLFANALMNMGYIKRSARYTHRKDAVPHVPLCEHSIPIVGQCAYRTFLPSSALTLTSLIYKLDLLCIQ